MSLQQKYKNHFPEAFIERMELILGEHKADDLLTGLMTPPLAAIRYNPKKTKPGTELYENHLWKRSFREYSERPEFVFDPHWHAGAYYVQDSSSIFLGEVFKNLFPGNQPLKVLDLCAAPGGKSTHLLSLLPEESLLVSNEIISKRNQVLRENMIKWGFPNVIVTQNDPKDFIGLGPFFDALIIDAPCSGEGLFGKDKKAMDQWSIENLAQCSIRQKKILEEAMHCLKPGGILIYSTCTFEPSENEDIIGWLVENYEFEQLEIMPFWEKYPEIIEKRNTHGNFSGLSFYPGKVNGSGFFISFLRKKNKQYDYPEVARSFPSFYLKTKLKNEFNTFINDIELFDYYQFKDTIYAFPKSTISDFDYLSRLLKITYFGIELGQMKGPHFIPAHALAVSTILNPGIPKIVIDKKTALQYLKCETVYQETKDINSWALVEFEENILGWIKVIPNRWNNYYPANWRIRKDLKYDE